MPSNVCEWGDGNQCPNESREDGSIYAQLCDEHAHEEAGLNFLEWGDVCLWCGSLLPAESANPCEDGSTHIAVPDGFPFHSEEDQAAITAPVIACDHCEDNGKFTPATMRVCLSPRAGHGGAYMSAPCCDDCEPLYRLLAKDTNKHMSTSRSVARHA